MSQPALQFRALFLWLMGFTALVWVWTVALILAWPWNKDGQWAADLPLVATCAESKACAVNYGEIAAARAKGAVLTVPADLGEFPEAETWFKWKKETGKAWQYEVARSSWHFQTTVRYKLEGDTPVLVAYRTADGNLLMYSLPLAAFTLLGLWLRKLRG